MTAINKREAGFCFARTYPNFNYLYDVCDAPSCCQLE